MIATERMPFFRDPMRCALIEAHALMWVGTPFVPHASIRGAGADCVQLAGCLYIEVGALDIFDPPKYSIDGGHHLRTSQVIEWIEQSGRFELAELAPAIGDLLCFRIGNIAHHVGVCFRESEFVHAIKDHGVVTGNLQDATWMKRLTAVYRPIEQ